MPQQVSSLRMTSSSDKGRDDNNHSRLENISTNNELEKQNKLKNNLEQGGDIQGNQINGNVKSDKQSTTNDKKVTNKPNGLKNRIIQRPPPLILDKVSNFYDYNESPVVQTTTNTSNNKCNEVQDHQQQHSSANQKFWASLNRNAASRTLSTGSINRENNNINPNIAATATKESVTSSSNHALGPDLIITHRNSSANSLSTNRTISSSSTLSTQPKSSSHQSNHNRRQHQHSTNVTDNIHIDEDAGEDYHQHFTNNENKSYEMSNTSNEILDDSSTLGGAPSDNDGGNLIGVDNPCTPPADSSGDALQSSNNFHNNGISRSNSIDDQPTSATSSRPRSNNPFLTMEDELNPPSPPVASHNNFHKRPASFIAATGSAIMKRQTALLNNSFHNDLSNNHDNIRIKAPVITTSTTMPIQDQFNAMRLDDNNQIPHRNFQQQLSHGHHEYVDTDASAIYQILTPQDYGDGSRQRNPTLEPQSSVHDIYSHSNSYTDREPAISVDSESAVCKPPPSATLQLPSWTDAIYELNNAILETNSVSGGAENGKFIYIQENGDIILELDRIKVSGFTLAEFIELVESKAVHLLKAVQTKHSQGLTIDLRQYLNSSFPKNSTDRELQDLIRENIYRRTIPCTTRSPKDGEVDKVDYHFLTREQFVEMNNRGMLLECGMFNGHYYGTIKPYSDLNSLSIYGTINRTEMSEDMQQSLNPSHPAIEQASRLEMQQTNSIGASHPLYENHDSIRLQHLANQDMTQSSNLNVTNATNPSDVTNNSIVAVDSESLPHGWERVIDHTHGTYYIDHNTQRTQYERPYDIELTKGSMGFGFTLVETENGLLLVRSIIPGGPAHLNGMIKPGDILISAVGVSVSGLQHTDVARLFSTFAVGDRVRMTFARGSHIVDDNLVPDEYLFSNGTNGDLAVAINPTTMNYFNHNMLYQSPETLANQEYEFITVTLKRGDQGFGFTISDSEVGQRVKKIQNNDACANLKQGDILISLNGQDITKLTHKMVVEQLKNCPPGRDVTLLVKRKRRFRSKTPMAMPTESGYEYSLDSAPQRNCKTPSLDCLMLRRPVIQTSSKQSSIIPTSQIPPQPSDKVVRSEQQNIYHSLPRSNAADSQSIYGTTQDIYYNQSQLDFMSPPMNGFDPRIHHMDSYINRYDSMTNSVQATDMSMTPMSVANVNNLSQINQYNNFMNNDKLMMMQMQQHNLQAPISSASHDYGYMPLYSNSEMIGQSHQPPVVPMRPVESYLSEPTYASNYQNYYANNEEIALQRMQYAQQNQHIYHCSDQHVTIIPEDQSQAQEKEVEEEYDYHQIDLDKGSTDLNWGIRLIGGSEVGRAISIGSIVFGGAASKNGKLKSGDEIISINGMDVVGATHKHVVELISSCSIRASLIVRRKKYAEACEVILTRNIDEGFGFVIISNENAALIGRIIKGSPADRCQQLHVRDQIVAVNGQNITPNMKHPEIVNMIKSCGSTLRLRVIPADCYSVELIKSVQNDNFGFSMRGGNEYDGMPLYILRVAPNGLARDLLNVGDQIIEINGILTAGMTHAQAATIIKKSDPIVKLKLRRNEQIPPSLLVDSPSALQKFNQVTAEMKAVSTVIPSISDLSGNQSDGSTSFDRGSILSQQQARHLHQSVEAVAINSQQPTTSHHLVHTQGLPLYAT